jgi:hypothetical protein
MSARLNAAPTAAGERIHKLAGACYWRRGDRRIRDDVLGIPMMDGLAGFILASVVIAGVSALIVVVFECISYSVSKAADRNKVAEWLTDITAELQRANGNRLNAMAYNAALLRASLEAQFIQWEHETAWEFPLLRLSLPTTRAAVLAAFRKAAHFMHPDKGGDAARFRDLIAERDMALSQASNGRTATP